MTARRLILIAAGVIAAGPAFGAVPLGEGARIAAERCGRCHAIGLAGDSPNPASPPFRTFGGLYPVADLLDALAQGATPSHTGMPRFKLNRRQTSALTQYVLSLQMGASGRR